MVVEGVTSGRGRSKAANTIDQCLIDMEPQDMKIPV